jgi:hypothetical protein
MLNENETPFPMLMSQPYVCRTEMATAGRNAETKTSQSAETRNELFYTAVFMQSCRKAHNAEHRC